MTTIATIKRIYGGASLHAAPNGKIIHEMSPKDKLELDDTDPVRTATRTWVHGRDMTSRTAGWVAEHLLDIPAPQRTAPPPRPSPVRPEPARPKAPPRSAEPWRWLWVILVLIIVATVTALAWFPR